jgi:hypothetical protein
LIVILGENDKPISRQVMGRGTMSALAVWGILARVYKTLLVGLRQVLDTPEIQIIPGVFPRQ